MREKINRLAKGIVDADLPKLVITPEKIEEAVQTGEVQRGEIYITGEDSQSIKGLVYSSDIRVHVCNDTFGGLRNHIVYEVNARHMSQGERITGSFSIVTNGGERKIPFVFTADAGASGRLLAALKKPEDIATIAKKDMEQALRLFDYKDFEHAPFMQDLHTSALYHGLKGRGDRLNLLEEFLIALKVKEPVTYEVEQENATSYFDLVADKQAEGSLLIRKRGWGYLKVSLTTDGNFIELSKKLLTDQDFQNDQAKISFTIRQDRLHSGRNIGGIVVRTVRDEHMITVEAQGPDRSQAAPADHDRIEDVGRYLELRLEFDCGLYENRLLLNQMSKELDRMKNRHGDSKWLTMMQAELALFDCDKDRAAQLLAETAEEVQQSRVKYPENYCYYQYLMFQTQKKPGQREALLHLVKKYYQEGYKQYFMFYLWLKLEPSMADNPGDLLTRLKQMYEEGTHSRFLYLEALRIYERMPQMLHTVGNFELQVLSFATRMEMIDEEMALRIGVLAETSRYYNRLFHRLLVCLYERFKKNELLEAVGSMMIKGNCRESQDFTWYQSMLEAGISLTRLYEYFLYTLPKDYAEALPKEVLLYFSYEKEIDRHSKSVLYMNILRYTKPESRIYQLYERDIEQFAMEQLFESRINSRLAVIYQHMLYKDMIDARVAKVLPSILNSYRIRCKNPNMKYVVVGYEETSGEDAFPLKDGVAYVPVFSDHSVLLFQDAYGNRYYNVDYRKQSVMDTVEMHELEERCFDIFPGHPMLRLQECSEIVDHGITCEADLDTLQRASEELSLNDLYQRRMRSAMIEYYLKALSGQQGEDKNDQTWLLTLDQSLMSTKERIILAEAYIRQSYDREAYELIDEYGYGELAPQSLLKLCGRMILQRMFDQDDKLLHMAYDSFCNKTYDSVILDYLCEHFNGLTDQMYEVLKAGVQEHVETYDLEERLLGQMLFTGEEKYADEVFDLYATRKKTSDSLVRAYFTARCVGYFMDGTVTDQRVFSYLEEAIGQFANQDRVPTIYLMALTKYYAYQKTLKAYQKVLCQAMADLLIREEKVFPYFKKLGRHISMPDSIMDKEMFEYRTIRGAKVELQVRILPEEQNYHGEEIARVYQGIFVKQKMLFSGETMEYRIFEHRDDKRVLVREGTMLCEAQGSRISDSCFAALNDMGMSLTARDEDTLKKKMMEYAADRVTAEELFEIM